MDKTGQYVAEGNFEKSNFFKYYHEKAGLSEAQLLELSPFYSFKEVSINQFLLREGEVCRHAFFVESGLLSSFSLDKSGKEHIIQFAPENWLLADRSSMYFDEPALYYVKAIEPSVVVYISPGFMESATKINAGFACFNDRTLHRNIYFHQKRINSLLAMSARERYESFVDMYPGLLLRVPQWMIASYLGITPESLSRVRREILKDHS